MKLIYIAGKYTGKTFNEVDDNIKKGIDEVAAEKERGNNTKQVPET